MASLAATAGAGGRAEGAGAAGAGARHTSSDATADILTGQAGRLGLLTLNRPKKLHGLSLDMVRLARPAMEAWRDDPSIDGVIIRSEPWGGKAFCAGGDVRAVYDAGKAAEGAVGEGAGGNMTADFFREEYELNHILASFPKPQVAFWDGIVMGGGVGLSVHGLFRIATEKSLFAMPETAIGLFPDVGMTHVLARLSPSGVACTPGTPSPLGLYLGLTGARLKWEDLVFAGLATHAVSSSRLQDLQVRLPPSPD